MTILTAVDRAFCGNNSDIMNHGMDPSPVAKNIMYSIKKAIQKYEAVKLWFFCDKIKIVRTIYYEDIKHYSSSREKSMAQNNLNRTAIINEPKNNAVSMNMAPKLISNKGFRPALSTMAVEMMVMTTFTAPINKVPI